MDVKEEAKEILSRLSDAMTDTAYDMAKRDMPMISRKMEQLVNAAEEFEGHTESYLANKLFNDPEVIGGFVGDWTFEAANGDQKKQKEILLELRSIGHEAVKQACQKRLARL